MNEMTDDGLSAMKYRLIKMFIVLLKISDYNLFIELTVQGLRHYWFLIL